MKFMGKLIKISAILLMATSLSTAHAAKAKDTTKSVVLVHGAFADGSSWAAVVALLQAKGIHVVAVQNPLTSLADDVNAVKRVLANQTGPVVLVGHSWGGMVITEAGNDDKVKALVYVAAFAADAGQSITSISAGYPMAPGIAEVKPDASGYLYLSETGFKDDFAQDLPEAITKVMWATQGPTGGSIFADTITTAAWKTKPSWYIVSENDRMIQPDLEKAMAATIKATITSLSTSHVPMLSKPDDVAKVIEDAFDAVQ